MSASYTYVFDTDLTANLNEFVNRGLREQAYVDSPTLRMLEKKTVSIGSEYINVDVNYVGTALGGPYSDNDQVSTAGIEFATKAQYQGAFYAEPARVSHTQMLKNKGPQKRFDLWARAVEQAKLRLRKKIAEDVFATSQVTKGLTGLPLAIPSTATSGTYGLNRATYDWWRNYTATSVGAYTTYGPDAMDTMLIDILTKTGTRPDFFVTTPTILQKAMKLARTNQRFIQDYKGKYSALLNDLGIEHISYQGIPFIADQYCDSGKLYAVNRKALYVGLYEDWNVTPEIDLGATGVQGMVRFVRWGGQLLCESQRELGQLSGLS